MLWPLKCKLSACTFIECYFFFKISQKEIWSKFAFAKFGSNHIIDQKQQQPCDIAPFSTSGKPVHSVKSKTKKQTKQNKKRL